MLDIAIGPVENFSVGAIGSGSPVQNHWVLQKPLSFELTDAQIDEVTGAGAGGNLIMGLGAAAVGIGGGVALIPGGQAFGAGLAIGGGIGIGAGAIFGYLEDIHVL